nr:hypothetical protein [Tanacetum cinerariifolium]
MEHAVKNAELSKPEIIKVVREIISEVRVMISGGKNFIKHQDAHLKVLHREHNEKLKNKQELMKKRYDNYVWSVTSRRKPEKSTDIHIHPRCHHSNKKNQCVGDLMKSISKKYKRMKGTAKTLESNESLTLPEQDPPLPSNCKRKAIGLETETYIASLHFNCKLPEERVSDIEKVETKTLLDYKIIALNVKSLENQRFIVLMNKTTDKCHDKEKLTSKKVKLEAL